jgi:eukaryotic-like serine/threonine-protein kinase
MSDAAADWKRMRSIFDAAISLAPADRDALLRRECAGDHMLRDKVAALIAAHDRADTFLETPARVVIGEPEPDPPDDLIDSHIGAYQVESRIGSGGMGVVYLARDAKLQRPVAIKLLSSSLSADPERLRRFRHEAHSVSALNHPNILVIHDFGESNGRPFMVTEFVEGQTLRQRMQSPLPLSEAFDVAMQCGQALAAAHARGIVHRDIKPENVMLRPDGYVKVLDFGLAKLSEAPSAPAARSGPNTTPGMVMGTPQYMSPEQARGLELDARSDVWSLGVMLYEMLAGRPPFAGATPADLIAALLSSEPVPLELKSPDVPAPLSRLVMRALKKNRGDRHSHAGEFVSELSALDRLLGDVVHTSPAALEDADESSTPRSRITKRTRIVVLPFRLLRPDDDVAFLGFSLADAVSTTLSNLDSLIVRSSQTASRFATADLDLHALSAATEVDAVLLGTLLRAGPQLRVSAQLLAVPDGTIMWSDRMDVAIDDLIRIQDELTARIVDSLALPLASREQQLLHRDVPASPKAYELYLRANSFFYSTEDWTIARDLYVECVTEDPAYAPAWARLGRCYRLTAKFRSASVGEMRDHLKRAEVAFRNAFEANPDLPLAHHLYTALETDLGRAEAAMLRLVRRARERRADPHLYAGLVHACRYCGLLDASVAAHDLAKRLDPQIATSVAQTYWLRGEYDRLPELGGLGGFFHGLHFVALGRNEDALVAAEQASAVVTDATTRSYQKIVPLLLKGDHDACRALLDDLAPRNPDPESIFHIARMYARLGAIGSAVMQFARAVDAGYFSVATFERDDWLDPLRHDPRFIAALARARIRHDDAVRKFRDAGGERLLR